MWRWWHHWLVPYSLLDYCHPRPAIPLLTQIRHNPGGLQCCLFFNHLAVGICPEWWLVLDWLLPCWPGFTRVICPILHRPICAGRWPEMAVCMRVGFWSAMLCSYALYAGLALPIWLRHPHWLSDCFKHIIKVQNWGDTWPVCSDRIICTERAWFGNGPKYMPILLLFINLFGFDTSFCKVLSSTNAGHPKVCRCFKHGFSTFEWQNKWYGILPLANLDVHLRISMHRAKA